MPIRSRTLWLALATLGLAQAARAADDTPPADPNLARWAVAGGAGAAAVRDAAAQGPVRDNAGLFKDETIRLAEKRIEEIRKRYDRDVLVVTFEKAPEDLARPVDFAAWVKKLLPPGFNGVCILICLEPRELVVEVTPGTEKLFGEWYQDRLKKNLKGKLEHDFPGRGFHVPWRKRENDEALLAGVEYIERKLDYNWPVDTRNWVWGLCAIAVIFGVWALLGVARARLRKRTPHEAGVREEDESGRSIAVLGGGIGAVSGQWLFDNLLFWRRREAAAAVPPDQPPHPEPPPNDDARGER